MPESHKRTLLPQHKNRGTVSIELSKYLYQLTSHQSFISQYSKWSIHLGSDVIRDVMPAGHARY